MAIYVESSLLDQMPQRVDDSNQVPGGFMSQMEELNE
jgi:hypothetical protein